MFTMRRLGMTIETIRHFFAWCTLINYVVLLLWVALTIWAPGFLTWISTKWFDLSVEKFRSLNYAGISFYKLGIILFNLTPYLALRILA